MAYILRFVDKWQTWSHSCRNQGGRLVGFALASGRPSSIERLHESRLVGAECFVGVGRRDEKRRSEGTGVIARHEHSVVLSVSREQCGLVACIFMRSLGCAAQGSLHASVSSCSLMGFRTCGVSRNHTVLAALKREPSGHRCLLACMCSGAPEEQTTRYKGRRREKELAEERA